MCIPVCSKSTKRWRSGPVAVTACRLLGLLLLVGIVAPASALEFECKINSERRFIRVELPGTDHLCEVQVSYQTGEQRVLWYADNETLFCSAKAYDLRKKYEDTWDFVCNRWPDRDGIDELSARHRYILDTQIKGLISDGKTSTTPFSVAAVKAAASTPINDNPGTLALQFFLQDNNGENPRDITQIIIDDGSSWKVLARIDSLAAQINTADDIQINNAIISAVTDAGAIEISTVVTADANSTAKREDCYGRQVLHAQDNGDLVARTPHRYVCTDNAFSASPSNSG